MESVSQTCQSLLPYLFIKGLGPAAYALIFRAFKNNQESAPERIAAILEAENEQSAALKIRSHTGSSDPAVRDKARAQADAQIKAARKSGVLILCALDSEYPILLNETGSDNPGFIFVKGRLSRNPAAAVIGSRSPVPNALIYCQRITEMLAGNGIGIISGLARGCDAMAHETALGLNGYTAAVTGTGPETVYPKEHEPLARRILDGGGALITAFPFYSEIRKNNFAVRDKYQAGLSDAAVLIQAGLQSGSLHACRGILKYQRDLFVVRPVRSDTEVFRAQFEANLILASKDKEQIRKLLKLSGDFDEDMVCVIRGRDTYPTMLERLQRRERPDGAETGPAF